MDIYEEGRLELKVFFHFTNDALLSLVTSEKEGIIDSYYSHLIPFVNLFYLEHRLMTPHFANPIYL